MALHFQNRHFLKLLDFTPEEISYLLQLAADLKKAKYAGAEPQRLKGKNIALIFEKTSTRTRCAFEVAAYDQGARVTYLDPTGSQLGKKESIRDTARVLGRMYDGIEYRGFEQVRIEELAKYAGVPVWNGLTNEFHPTQALADLLTMQEHSDKPSEAGGVRLSGRRAQQRGQLASDRRRQDGHGLPCGRAQRASSQRRAGGLGPGNRQGDRGADHHHR